MNDVTKAKLANWAGIIKQRTESGLSIREWCSINNVSRDAYYYWLRKLRKIALENGGALPEVNPARQTGFALLTQDNPADGDSDGVAVRIKRGDIIIEVSNDASGGVLSLLKEVLTDAL